MSMAVSPFASHLDPAVRTLTAAQVIAVEDATRRRIERELHDGLQQQLVALALRVRAAEAMVPVELAELRAELARIVDDQTTLLDQVREIAHGVHPAILFESGLKPALKSLAHRSPIPVELRVGCDADLPDDIELVVYYVVAEALTNTAKYSHASLVRVLVETGSRAVRIAVCDDGVGGANPTYGTGLLGLQQRARAAGGTLWLDSPRGGGTSLVVELPLDGDELSTRRSSRPERGSHDCRCHRDAEEPDPRGVEEGVRDRGTNRGGGRLA
jgi:signal transduction histidine kinase